LRQSSSVVRIRRARRVATGAVVEDQKLEVVEGLRQDAVDRQADEAFGVVGAYDDRRRACSCGSSFSLVAGSSRRAVEGELQDSAGVDHIELWRPLGRGRRPPGCAANSDLLNVFKDGPRLPV
jgi:hypothetical protein